MSEDPPDGGDGDAVDAGGDAGPDVPGPEGEQRRKRRRRRRRGAGPEGEASAGAQLTAGAPPTDDSTPPATGDRGAPDVHPPERPGGPAAIHHREDPNARGRRRRGRDREAPAGDAATAAAREGGRRAREYGARFDPAGEPGTAGGSTDAAEPPDGSAPPAISGDLAGARPDERGGRGARGARSEGGGRGARPDGGGGRGARPDDRGGRGARPDDRGPAGSGGGGEARGERRGGRRGDEGRGGGGRTAEGRGRSEDRSRERTGDPPGGEQAPSGHEPITPRLEARRPRPDELDELADSSTSLPTIAWGTDDDQPAPAVVLVPDLPAEAPADDEDPLTYPLLDGPGASLGGEVASVCGVRFVPGGRLQWFDAGDADLATGDRVLVDSERGTRLGWIAAAPTRRSSRERGLRRVIRRATEQDLRGEREGEAERARVLRLAKDIGSALRLPLKVFRIEIAGQLGRGAKLNVYYTTDERLDLRDFVRDLGRELQGARIELRQLGVRDEAKAVGGIGSCGLTLCCTTWLPDFVPVSIKMAKDQGLVLSPTKVSGQCGRLKCCLVYEQAGYAELRKGLPKLGKRVVGARGEGRVVEVDVLRQRVRVSYGPGDTEVVPAAEVTPVFPSGNPPREPRGDAPPRSESRRRDPKPAADVDPSRDLPDYGDLDDTDDPSALEDLGPTDDPSSLHHVAEPDDDLELPEPDPLADIPDLPDDEPA